MSRVPTDFARPLAAPHRLVADQAPQRVESPGAAVGASLHESLLYEEGDSPFGLEARIALQLKGVPFRTVTAAPARAATPPDATPVLVQGETTIAGAARIARHLESCCPEPMLIPPGPEARAYAVLLEEWARSSLHLLVGACKWLNPANRDAAMGNTVAASPLRPLLGRLVARRMRRRWEAQGWTWAASERLTEDLRAQVGTLAVLVGDRPYLLGRTPTLADVAVFAQLMWLGRYAEGRILGETPAVTAWLDRLASLPPVAAALAP